MKIVKVLKGDADLDRKTYILWTLPFVIILSMFFLAEYIPLFTNILMNIFGQASIFDYGSSMLLTMGFTGVSFVMVFILSGKRLVELEESWLWALLLFLYPIFLFLYVYLVFRKEPKWKIAERSRKTV